MSHFFSYDQRPIEIKTSLDKGFTDKHQTFHYIKAENVFTPDECNQIVASVESNYKLHPGVSRNQEIVDYRNSDVCFLEPGDRDGWIYERFVSKMGLFNKYFGFDLSHLSRIQYAKYAENQFLDWHTDDSFKYYYDDPENDNYTMRKLSISVFLSDPNSYVGGEFEILMPTGQDFEPAIVDGLRLNTGDALLFPSFYPHRVLKVTEGIRRSLVCWFYGPKWR